MIIYSVLGFFPSGASNLKPRVILTSSIPSSFNFRLPATIVTGFGIIRLVVNGAYYICRWKPPTVLFFVPFYPYFTIVKGANWFLMLFFMLFHIENRYSSWVLIKSVGLTCYFSAILNRSSRLGWRLLQTSELRILKLLPNFSAGHVCLTPFSQVFLWFDSLVYPSRSISYNSTKIRNEIAHKKEMRIYFLIPLNLFN